MRTIACFVTAAVAASLAASVCPAADEVELPITKVTAFSSGVAYFGHSGKVDGDAKVLLKFKIEQINDVLKSLVPLDLGGGDVTVVSYASRDPVSRALKSFGIDISGQPTLAQLLRQVRGAEVVVATPEKITGTILGLETRTEHLVDSNTVIRREVLNLLTDSGIRAVKLDEISSIALADEKLNAELNKALALLAESRDSDRKPVTIQFAGKCARDVSVGYVAEAPVWKTSYRLVLGEKDVALQGWAIVENTSDFDWENVDLTLVSGRPISFIQDLYTPLYLPRPVVRPELYASLRPQRYDEGLAEAEAAKPLELVAGTKAVRARRKAGPAEAAAPARFKEGLYQEQKDKAGGRAYDAALRRGAASVAAAAKVGELFSYHIGSPVTLGRRKSAMLSIVNQPVKARKVSIYNASVLAKHPLNGLWLTNDTGLSLLGGPITVFAGGTYAGDAQIDGLSPNGERLLSYAIDLKVTVVPSSKSDSKITTGSIVRGVLRVSRKRVYVQEYLINNKADEKRTMLIEHPRRSDRKLVSPAEPTRQTAQVYRFETDVAAGKTGKFEVKEERTDWETIAILRTGIKSLQWYTTNAAIPEKVRDALAEAIKRKQALEAVQRQVSETERSITRLETDQRRTRENMRAVSRGGAAYQRFEKKLLDVEAQIEKLQTDLATLKAEADDLRSALEEHLKNLNVD